jgi:hypothetical protein
MIALALAPGSGILAILVFVFVIAMIYALFTVKGSGISERPYAKVYGGAPGATGSGSASGHDERVTVRDWSRGAR